MTVVVADTSPLNYLVLIGEIELLPALYTRILIPNEVFTELTDQDAPRVVLDWVRSRPEWLEIRKVDPSPKDLALTQIDPGESAAILLAQQQLNSLLLI